MTKSCKTQIAKKLLEYFRGKGVPCDKHKFIYGKRSTECRKCMELFIKNL